MEGNFRCCLLLMLLCLSLSEAYGHEARVESASGRLQVGITIVQACRIAEPDRSDPGQGARNPGLRVSCTQGVRYNASVAGRVQMAQEPIGGHTTMIVDF